MQKKSSNSGTNLNFLLFLLTLLAGIVWWGIGEVFLSFTKAGPANIIRNPLLNGVYFALLSLLSIFACLLSENKVHSIVEKDFFNEVVLTQSLKKIMPVAFTLMFLAAGLLEFVYEIELSPAKPAPVQPNTPVTSTPKYIVLPVDYYFLLDNTTSLGWNDPDELRFDVLEKIVNTFSEDKRIALITFGYNYKINMYPEYATTDTKRLFIYKIRHLTMEDSTSLKNALIGMSSILVNDYSRKEVVVFITDGEDNFSEYSAEFNRVMAPYISASVPIHSIFLNPEDTDSSFLKRVSLLTGGIYSTVKDPLDLESQMVQVIESEEESITINQPIIRPGKVTLADPPRDMLEMRTGKRQNSPLHIIMRIVFITLIGILMGYLLYMVFSSSRIFLSLLIGGGISGFLAGLFLEFCFQVLYLPDFIIHLLICITLSTVFWLISLVSGFVFKLSTGRPIFEFWNFNNNDIMKNNLYSNQSIEIDSGVLNSKEKVKTNSSKRKLGK